MTPPIQADRIAIAILALGGQGGGVLADWIQDLAADNGYLVQGTSVPGVAQRTGSTVYYIEMIRRPMDGANRPAPVLALMPVPGDVDVVVASELMEGGRAMLRGFVTADRTTLVSSTHRVYAISEKSAAGDGTRSTERILRTARQRARRFVGFDMEGAANAAGSVISSVMFGALAASGALPFEREAYEQAIRRGGKAVAANLKGFEAGWTGVERGEAPVERRPALTVAAPTTQAGRDLANQVRAHLPPELEALACEGARRLMEYQDLSYAQLYLSRLERLRPLDLQPGSPLLRETARWLALWMAYEDTIRVADLKVRASRSARVAAEVRLGAAQVMRVTEYMHPRLREVCDVLPARLGEYLGHSPWARRLLEPLFAKGRHVETTSVFWFVALSVVAGLRPLRPVSLRYREEQARIETWLDTLARMAPIDAELCLEVASAPRLLKGYGDTFDRGLVRFDALMALANARLGQAGAAAAVRALREANLADVSDAPCATPGSLAITPADPENHATFPKYGVPVA